MINRINELVDILNNATYHYDLGKPIMTDQEWDKLYFELVELEKESNYILVNSPTQSISYEVVNQLEKVEHNHKMLSLEKTKDLNVIESFLKNKDYLIMSKMDGLTCSLKYLNGKLISAETRGNGIIGENILHNAKVISSIPKKIDYQEELIVDGEIICDYESFKDFEKEYKNPRNFASGSIRLLNSKECGKRKLSFIAWDVIEGFKEYATISEKFVELDNLGFKVVPYFKVSQDRDLQLYIERLNIVNEFLSYPVDGAVFKFDDIQYGKSLGETAHHFKNAMAYKFYDETYSTNLKDIEWTMGRTGILTPVAIFEPIEIDGSIVERASLHNITILEQTLGTKPFIGQKLWVSKRNMIIPQIEEAEKNYE